MPGSETWHQLRQLHPHPAGAQCWHRRHAREATNRAGKGETLQRQSLCLSSPLSFHFSGILRDSPLCPCPLCLPRARPGSLCIKNIACISSCCWDQYLFYPSARQMEKLSLGGYKSGQFIHFYCSGSADCWKGTTACPWEGTPRCAASSARQPQAGFQLQRATRRRSYASSCSS